MITLRPATPADLPAAVEVFWACWTRSYRSFATADQLARLSRADAETLWADAWARDHTLLAADPEGRIVGLARYGIRDGLTAVHSLYVHPDCQGGGVGGRLLAAATGDGLRRGAPDSSLWVFADNDVAREFYTRQGYLPDGTTRTTDQFGLPEIRLSRTGLPIAAVAGALVETVRTRVETVEATPDAPHPVVSTSSTNVPGHTPSETPPPSVEPVETTHQVSTSSTTVPGAVLGVWTPGGGVHTAAAGVRGPDGAPMTTDTVHDLASVTKLFTTAAILRLNSAGEVDLDAPVDRHLPFPEPVPTVRQLLRHRSGLLPWQPLYLRADHPAAAVELIRALPRAAAPDRERNYSDLGFILLGAVITRVTGQDLRSALAELITTPLGIDVDYGPRASVDVTTSSLDDRVERRMVATGEPYPVIIEGRFDRWRNEPSIGVVNDGNAYHALGGVSGHAGLFASIHDLVTFGRALTHSDHGLWRAETLAEFRTPGPDPEQALGFRIRDLPSGRRLAWHPGFTGTALGVVGGAQPLVVAMATNRLATDNTPIPTDRLWADVLRGSGIDREDSR